MLRFREVRGLLPGLLSVAGAFLIQVLEPGFTIFLIHPLQLGVGSYHGTFGNLLPYFSSYMRQVSRIFFSPSFKRKLSKNGH